MFSSARFKGDLPRINAADYVREFTRVIEQKEGRRVRGKHLGEAMHLQQLLHLPESTSSKSVRDLKSGEYFWGHQKVEYVRSNLGIGKGYVWYFICNGCERRVKFLYESTPLRSPLCGRCQRISYRQPSRSSRKLSRLLKAPQPSTETKRVIIKLAGIRMSDFEENVENHADKVQNDNIPV